MQRRKPSSALALLEKANSQLKGEKIAKPEDELNDYISSLTQKTSKQQKLVNFEDLGDSISISSDLEDIPVKQASLPAPSAGSKFLKKKPSVDEPDQDVKDNVNKFLKKPQLSTGSPSSSVQTQQRYGSQSAQSQGSSRPGSKLGTGRQGSSALDKASALTGKIQQRVVARKPVTIESDSDESFSAMKLARSSGELARSSGELISESQSDSVKVGRDKGKFLKKSAAPSPAPATQVELPSTSVGKSAGGSHKSTTKPSAEATNQKKASPFQLKSSLKYSTDVVLTSEEESLAEFVGGLPSSSDSLDKPKRQYGRSGRHTPSPPPVKHAKGRRTPSPPPPNKSRSTSKGQGRSVSPQNKPPMVRRTPSPSPRNASPGLRRRSPSPKLVRSYSDDSNIAESIKDEVVEDYNLGFNVIMDLDDLGPSVEEELPQVGEAARSESPVRSTARKSKKDKKKSKKSKSETSISERNDSSSPFKAKKESDSPFRAKSADRDKSPFKASNEPAESPFKAKSGKDSSPFKANKSDSKSLFHAGGSDSPFKSKAGSSPFKSSNEGSVFKVAERTKSPKPSKRSTSPFKSKDKSSKKAKDKKKEKSQSKGKSKSSDIFGSFGIQSVDDLFERSVRDSEYESVRSEVDEVISEISEEIKTDKPGAYSYSQRFEDSATEIPTEAEVTRPSNGYTEDFESISERVGYRSDAGRSSASEVRTRYSGDETAASFTEFSETESYISESKYTDDEDDRTYSESYTEYSEDFTKSVVPTRSSRSDMTPRPPRGMTSAEVQTAMDGLLYSWNPAGVGMSMPSTPYGLHFVDPTPIATQVVSADALEAMTSYSPAMLALHDMLKSQLQLTKEFLDMQKRTYSNFSSDLQHSFKYTTLEDTKKYIKKNKKKKMTFKEALQLVDLEMMRS